MTTTKPAKAGKKPAAKKPATYWDFLQNFFKEDEEWKFVTDEEAAALIKKNKTKKNNTLYKASALSRAEENGLWPTSFLGNLIEENYGRLCFPAPVIISVRKNGVKTFVLTGDGEAMIHVKLAKKDSFHHTSELDEEESDGMAGGWLYVGDPKE